VVGAMECYSAAIMRAIKAVESAFHRFLIRNSIISESDRFLEKNQAIFVLMALGV